MQHQSMEIFSALLSVMVSETGLVGGPTASPKPSGLELTTGTMKGASMGSLTKAPGATGTSSDAQIVMASGLVGLLGVVFSALMFA